jgi:hypothetical protein
VVVVSPAKSLLRDVRLAVESLAAAEGGRVHCCSPDELFEVLGALDSRGQMKEQTVRGYRVKVRVADDPHRSPESARNTIASVLAKSFQRLKRKG